MLVITGIFENERFIPDKPVSIPQKKKVRVTIEEHTAEASSTEKTVETKPETTAEKVENFRRKYNHGTFVEHLKKLVAEGHSFDFDVQKVIDGTETEADMQIRYRLEKQAWGNAVKREV
jgi:transcription elongation factor